MNSAHLHLILNHTPVVSSFIALILVCYGIFFKNRSILHAGLVTIIVAAIISIPVFISGDNAEHVIENMRGVSLSAIEVHEEQATLAFWCMIFCGSLSLITLITSIKNKMISTKLTLVTFVVLFFVVIMLMRAGYSGGEIHHPEIHQH